MKTISYFFVLITLLTSLTWAESSSGEISENEEKLYIESGTVQIENNEIFLNLNGRVLPIASLGKDRKGVYATAGSVWMVKCPRCDQFYNLDSQSRNCPHGLNVHH